MTHRIEVDRSRPLHEGAARGHNRWHPGLAPVASVDSGEEVEFELRGLARAPAYVLISVAAELRISELVDAPNALVSAAPPLEVFED